MLTMILLHPVHHSTYASSNICSFLLSPFPIDIHVTLVILKVEIKKSTKEESIVTRHV